VARATGGGGGGEAAEAAEAVSTATLSEATAQRAAAAEAELAERQGRITELALRVMELEGDLEAEAAHHRREV
jgi:hypothetical protein